MALLARTFQTVVGFPWKSLELLDRAMRWSAVSELMEESTDIWAEDLFPPCSNKSCVFCSDDDVSSGSETCDDEDESDDEEWSDSEEEEEIDGFCFQENGNIEFWGDCWFWTGISSQEEDLNDLQDVEMSTYSAERLVDYVMPSMDFNMETVDTWVDKYGSSRLQIRFVTVTRSEQVVDNAFVLPATTRGLFVAVL